MDVSVVIVSYNGRDLLRSCLSSLYQHTRNQQSEVIVVDNASRDGTPEMVAAEFSQVRLVRRSANGGYARAVNQGFALAQGTVILVLNPDAELTADILTPMRSYLIGHPKIGILAPKLTNGDGSLQLSCRAFPGFSAALFNRYSLLTRLFPSNRFSARYLMSAFDHSTIADVDWVSGACWLLPRTVYEEIGPLDERYFWSIEDVDYCQRVHRAGKRVVYYPEVSLVHHIGGSSATLPNRSITERHRGMWRYYRQYLRPRSAIVRVAVDSLAGAGIFARLIAQLTAENARRVLRSRRRRGPAAQS